MNSGIDLNKEFLKAYHTLENSLDHIFVTGKAGTGKSTLLQYFRDHTTKNVAVLAPTGVAAVNVGGQTIHSFFRFKPDITIERVAGIRIRREDREIFLNLDAVIIDEVSMVRADLLDCVDEFLRKYGPDRGKPFGGVQMIFIGDLFQLPPVVPPKEAGIFRGLYESPYFFSSKAFQAIHFTPIDLSRIYRQEDDEFIALLNAIRKGQANREHLSRLNERCRQDFIPHEEDFYIYLTTTNALADRINIRKINTLDGQKILLEGEVDGRFEDKVLPTKKELIIKTGAQVMILNNDPEGRWVNGTIGKVTSVAEDLTTMDIITVMLEDGREVDITPFKWEMFRFFYNTDTGRLESESVGSFTQYPLRLAWAITIHKSQGKTFSHVILDIGAGAFAHGQTYVALSRCTDLKGLVLQRPISLRDIILDKRITVFMDSIDVALARNDE